MEQRQHQRKMAPKNQVYVYYKSQRVQRCSARDISVCGVFLSTPVMPVPVGAKVQLIFVLSQGSVVKTHRKSALLTRIEPRGAGFAFLSARRQTPPDAPREARW